MEKLNENTQIPIGWGFKAAALGIGSIAVIGTVVWWAATLTSNVGTMKTDIADIKTEIRLLKPQTAVIKSPESYAIRASE
jgi:uncharacterized protein YfaP (DUF2135 family)